MCIINDLQFKQINKSKYKMIIIDFFSDTLLLKFQFYVLLYIIYIGVAYLPF